MKDPRFGKPSGPKTFGFSNRYFSRAIQPPNFLPYLFFGIVDIYDCHAVEVFQFSLTLIYSKFQGYNISYEICSFS